MKFKEKIENAKSYVQRNQKKVILLVCCVVIIGGLVTTTLAWLTAKAGPVVNNFIGSELEIDLAETATEFQMVPHLVIPKDPTVTVKANSEACWLFLQVKESAAQAKGSGITKVQGGLVTQRTGEGYKYLKYEVLPATSNDHTGEGWIPMTEQQVIDAGFPATSDDGSVNTYYYRQVGEDGTAISTDLTYEILTTLENEVSVRNKVMVNDYIINDELTESQLTANPVKITFTPAAVQRLGFNFTDAGKEVAQFFH